MKIIYNTSIVGIIYNIRMYIEMIRCIENSIDVQKKLRI